MSNDQTEAESSIECWFEKQNANLSPNNYCSHAYELMNKLKYI